MKRTPEELSLLYSKFPGQFLTEKQAAHVLAVSTSSLQKQRHQRKGPPYYKLGKSVRYYLPELISFAEQRRIDPSDSSKHQSS